MTSLKERVEHAARDIREQIPDLERANLIEGHQFIDRQEMEQWADLLEESAAALVTSLEVCLCSAIKLEDGRIVRGHRHDDCIRTITNWKNAGQDVGIHGNAHQGFLTSFGRFVDRVEAYQLQEAAGLLAEDRRGAHELTSEELY